MPLKRLNILVVEPSQIIRRGVISVILDADGVGVDVIECSDLSNIEGLLERFPCDIVLINPLHLGSTILEYISNRGIKIIALQTFILSKEQLAQYDGVISILGDTESVGAILQNVAGERDTPETTLSLRECDIVRSVAIGLSNKEIADKLSISVHTVMTHRKNIASKLKINNAAGLAIYAITNKLIGMNDVT